MLIDAPYAGDQAQQEHERQHRAPGQVDPFFDRAPHDFAGRSAVSARTASRVIAALLFVGRPAARKISSIVSCTSVAQGADGLRWTITAAAASAISARVVARSTSRGFTSRCARNRPNAPANTFTASGTSGSSCDQVTAY